MTELNEVILKRIFEKLDNIDNTLNEQCKRISHVEASNKLIESIWKKILVALGTVSTIISVLVVLT